MILTTNNLKLMKREKKSSENMCILKNNSIFLRFEE